MKHFLDIGANCGQTFDWLATQPNDYRDHLFWLFEPSPRHFAALMQKCEEQAKKGYRIRLCPFGLGGDTSVAKFFLKDDPQGDSFEQWTESDHIPKNVSLGWEVYGAQISISDFIIAQTKRDDEIVLDIDAEGAEYGLLWDLISHEKALNRVGRIIVEFHSVMQDNYHTSKKLLCEIFSRAGLPIEVRGFVP